MRTEDYNLNSANIDRVSSQEFVEIFLQEDQKIWQVISKQKKEIAEVIDCIFLRFSDFHEAYQPYEGSPYKGPRIFYFGAGTSGRLGILDASECPPTFSTHPDMVQGIIAGGDKAIRQAIENAEDDEKAGRQFVCENFTEQDIAIGISANGNAAFVMGALDEANKKSCLTVAITNNQEAKILQIAQKNILIETGAEIISGSTRLKAGTAQKIILNMISTGLMVKLGKVYGNLMVDLKASNTKLRQRALRLVCDICKCPESQAIKALEACNYKVKNAIVSIKKNVDHVTANNLLKEHKYQLAKVIE